MCRSVVRQLLGQISPRSARSIHDIRQGKAAQIMEQKQCDRSFDVVEITYCRFDNVKFVIFFKLRVHY